MKIKAYLSVFLLRLKMDFQYRGAVIGGCLCQLFFGLILVSLYRALYANRPQSIPIESVASYVWLQQAFFRMLLSSDNDLAAKIRTGDIAYDLCRPLDLYGFYYARILAQKLIGSLLRAIPMLVFAVLLPPEWGLCSPASFPAFLLGVLGLSLGLACICALENITVGVTMRTLDPRGMQAMLNLLMMFMAGNILPLTLFPDAWQKALTLLPWAQILDAPIRFYTGSSLLSDAPRVLLVQAIWVLLLTFLGRLLWRQNQKKLVLQGG